MLMDADVAFLPNPPPRPPPDLAFLSMPSEVVEVVRMDGGASGGGYLLGDGRNAWMQRV